MEKAKNEKGIIKAISRVTGKPFQGYLYDANRPPFGKKFIPKDSFCRGFHGTELTAGFYPEKLIF